MKFAETALPGLFQVELEPFSDERGWFSRTYCEREFAGIGFTGRFVQINHSFNRCKGTFRGFHYQEPPMHETKLIRCLAGSVLDAVVDVRKGSPTFLKSHMVELSAENRRMLLIPAGFAHGFLTLTDDASLIYHHSQFYSKEHERGVRYDDPRIQLAWPIPISVISDRDLSLPALSDDFDGITIAAGPA